MERSVTIRKLATGIAATGVVIGLGVMAPEMATASTLPSGETVLGQSTLEPAYNDANGSLVYLLTPDKAPVHPNDHNVAPLYLPIYPADSTVGTLNCEDTTATTTENCPDHGPELAGLAEGASPMVYASGVLGHNHLLGIASTGGDFNVEWLPVAVVFTPKAVADGAINENVTTVAAVDALVSAKDAFTIELPPAIFNCAVVSAAVYQRGTPVG